MVGVITSREVRRYDDNRRVNYTQSNSYTYSNPVYNQVDGSINGSETSSKPGLEGITIEEAMKSLKKIVNSHRRDKDIHSLMESQEFIEAVEAVVELLNSPDLDPKYAADCRREYRTMYNKARKIEEGLFMERKSRLARKIGKNIDEHYHPKERRGRKKGENTSKEPALTTIRRPR